ncbi:MAG TPA: hypothetical protein V6D07_18725 [Trichocoleus sp.]
MQSTYRILFNWGLGVESTALIVQWILHPDTRPLDPTTGSPIDLDQIIVLFAATGHEYPTTRNLAETHVLPLFRKHRIRLIQAGRGGPSFNDGIVIVSDTAEPYRLYACYDDAIEAGIWTLGTELETSAVAVRLNRPHTCSMKFKGWVLDQVISLLELLARVYGPESIPELSSEMYAFLIEEQRHYKQMARTIHKALKSSGLSKPESYLRDHYPAFDPSLVGLSKSKKSLKVSPPKVLLFGPILGYNADEVEREKTSDEYGCRGELYLYPAIERGWSRLMLWTFLWLTFKVDWLKSACRFCPFPEEEYIIARGKIEPDGLAEAIMREAFALLLNHRMHLFGHHSAYEMARLHVPEAIAIWQQQWNAIDEWSLMRVRRIYLDLPAPTLDKPTKWRVDSARETIVISQGSYSQMMVELHAIASQPGWHYEELTQIDMQCRKFRSNRKLVLGKTGEELYRLTLEKVDLRGEPYMTYRVPVDDVDKFKCHPIPRAVHFIRDWCRYPSVEEFVVVVPAVVRPKVQNRKTFDARWAELTDLNVNLQRDVLDSVGFILEAA